MTNPNLVQIGRRTPTRAIVASIALAAAGMLFVAGLTVLYGHVEQAPLALIFLLIPIIVIPASIALNTFAEFDPATGLISVNGAPATPLSDVRYGRTDVFRGVCTLTLGYDPTRSRRFAVSSSTPFGSPRIERDWVRFMLPFTGLPRDDAAAAALHPRCATLDEAQQFAVEWLK